MKFILASYGTRGDVEPCAAVGLELMRRGHDVHMAVPTNMVDLVESAGLAAVAYGPNPQALRDEDFARNLSKIGDPINLLHKVTEHVIQVWLEMGAKLTALADGADLLMTSMSEQELAANVAEYHGIPLAALHLFPVQLLPLGELHSRISKEALDAQRRALGLPEPTGSSMRGIAERGVLEIQAYDEFFFPELAAEWTRSNIRRPFVGALTMDLPTDADGEVLSWIAAGTPPIYFGFGSTPVRSPADMVAMISEACLELGERALIYPGVNGLTPTPHSDHVKIVGAVNYAAVFPACRAVVHHGGAGTTAAGLRAGIPTLVLWTQADQPIWAVQVERLKVGFARPFRATTRESLIADLRRILGPQYAMHACDIAIRMTKPTESVTGAADQLEESARLGRFA